MADSPSLRSRVVSLVIAALDKISENLGIDVRLEGSKLIVTADLAGVTEAQGKRGPGRPPTTAFVPASAVPAEPTAAPRAKRGGKKRGRPGKNTKSAKTAPATKPPTRDFSREAILAALRNERPGFSLKALTKHLGGDKRHKASVKPVLRSLMKTTGDDRVEYIGGRFRLKNLDRSAGRPKKGGTKKAGGAATASKPAKRGPGRPPGSKNRPKAAESAKTAGRKPGRPAKPAKQPKKKRSKAQKAAFDKMIAAREAKLSAKKASAKKAKRKAAPAKKAAARQPAKKTAKKAKAAPKKSGKKSARRATPAAAEKNSSAADDSTSASGNPEDEKLL